MSAQQNLPDNDFASRKRLFGAYTYTLLGKPRLQHVSHNVRALKRRNQQAIIFQVRCVAREATHATYERVSKEPVAA